MDEVEKMYKNANVEKHLAYFECHRGRSTIGCPINRCEKDDKCIGCINSSAMKDVYKYPPFTAEKQIELIKWFTAHWCYFTLGRLRGLPTFEESLAHLINYVWQALSEEEKQEVKEILE